MPLAVEMINLIKCVFFLFLTFALCSSKFILTETFKPWMPPYCLASSVISTRNRFTIVRKFSQFVQVNSPRPAQKVL